MKAHLRSARIAPKKANLIAKMVRGMPVTDAQLMLKRTHKKAARMIEKLLASAVANAEHNDKQNAALLLVKTIVVQQGTAYQRGVPMARGRVRPMQKFLSHISLTLGVAADEEVKKDKAPSQGAKTQVKSTHTSGAKGRARTASSPKMPPPSSVS